MQFAAECAIKMQMVQNFLHIHDTREIIFCDPSSIVLIQVSQKLPEFEMVENGAEKVALLISEIAETSRK